MRAGLSAPSFGIIATLGGFLLFVLVLHHDPIDDSRALHVLSPRQGNQAADSAAATSPAAAATSQPQAAASTQQQAATSNTPAAASSKQQQQATSTLTSQASAAQQSTTQAPAQTSNTPSNGASNSATLTPATITSALVTTNAGGQVVTSVVYATDGAAAASSASPSSTSGSSSSSSGSSGLSTSTIIGISVAGGVALLCVAGFFVWKFTRKRLGDYDNNEEIKWPELNSHDTSVPLPTNRTGGSGFDTGLEGAGRSSVGYASSTGAHSTTELQPDPYAVPPLPHLDPNQPYHDDPSARFYDPYRGPIPPSFEPPTQGGEAIAMTQLAGRRSPGPGTAYGGDFGSGRASPGPHAAYGVAVDPAARASPAPLAAYNADFGGRASPGPRAPYAGGRVSPGPQAAYGNVYGPR